MKLADLMKVNLDITVTGLTLDSRVVNPGNIFFAREGTHLDGKKFIDDAISKGASAIVVEGQNEINWQGDVPIISIPDLNASLGNIAAKFYDFPAKQLSLIGVTGTSGKTSCTHFIADALAQIHQPCGIIGTLGNGLYGHLHAGSLTTPDIITIQKTFAEFLQQRAKFAAMEVSSHSLDQGRVSGIEFDVGVFTNLTRDHLDYHQSMEAYGAAKRRLFDQTKYAVVNADDAFGEKIIASLPAKSLVAYTTKTHLKNLSSVVLADQISLDDAGIHANVYTPWGKGELHAPLIGEFNLSNLLAVLSSLCLLEIPLPVVLNCLTKLQSVPGRMQLFKGQRKPLVVVDYAHKPDALEKVLIALRKHCHGKLYCVFGCGGDRDRGKRPLMAKIAETYADQVIVTDDNPRHEDPAQIVADIMQGFTDPTKIIVQHDRSKAIHNVIQYAAIGDCILVAGKGAETYQQIGDDKIPFSDVEKVNACLAE